MRLLIPLLLLSSTIHATAPEPFAVEVGGNPKGQPVILIPGLSSSGAVWRDTVAHLAPKYQCHVLTLAGFAGQARLSDGPFLAQVRDAIVNYINTQQLKQPILIGHSLGGHMALWIASLHPNLIGRLVIVDSLPHLGAMMNPDPQALRKQAEGMRLMIGSQSQEQYNKYIISSNMLKSMVGDNGLAQVTDWSLHSDPIAVSNAMFDLYTTDLREAIAAIKSPTLLLSSWIGYKAFTTRENSVALVEAQYAKLPGKTLKVSDTAKHFIMLDDPEWYLLQLDNFLQ